MRIVFAAALALLVLATSLAPHVHEGELGRHACVACVAANGEQASCATPSLEPLPLVARALPVVVRASPVTGAPLGAIPGQSPPRA